MSTSDKNGSTPAPSTRQLREQAAATREELGRTVDALAAQADVKDRALRKAGMVAGQVRRQAGQAKAQAQETAAQALHLMQDKVPEPVRERTAQAATQLTWTATTVAAKVQQTAPEPVVRTAAQVGRVVRRNRMPLIGATAALAVFTLVRRARRGR